MFIIVNNLKCTRPGRPVTERFWMGGRGRTHGKKGGKALLHTLKPLILLSIWSHRRGARAHVPPCPSYGPGPKIYLINFFHRHFLLCKLELPFGNISVLVPVHCAERGITCHIQVQEIPKNIKTTFVIFAGKLVWIVIPPYLDFAILGAG